MFLKLRSHVLLALSFLLLTLAQQYLFYGLKGLPIVWLSFGKYLTIFGFFLLASFIQQKNIRFFFLGFVLLLNFFQMAHLSYFGTQILPAEFYLFFTQWHEIQGTLLEELHHIYIPLAFTLIPLLIGGFTIKKIQNLYSWKWTAVIFALYFIYNPTRTFVTGNTWGRQPSTRELGGMNVYLSSSYFLGKILPHKLQKKNQKAFKNFSTELKLSLANKPKWDKIIVVLGESLSPHHMELFGYERPTTPFLVSQKNNPNFSYSVGLSGGVSTDIAVAFLLNMGFGNAGSLKAATGEHCLFKLAKGQGLKTRFHSIQSSQQLRYIAPYVCGAYLDDYRSMEQIAPHTTDHQAALDQDLLPELKNILKNKNQEFIILHQRGSHGPWALRSTKESQKFPHDSPVNHYDNSVIEFDEFMKKLHEVAIESKEKILVVYFSDHGEGVGRNGLWGHGSLNTSSFEIPILMMSFNQDLPVKLTPFLTHYNMSLLLAKELGYQSNQDPLARIENYVIFGNDIDGFAGNAEISWKPDGTYDFKVLTN